MTLHPFEDDSGRCGELKYSYTNGHTDVNDSIVDPLLDLPYRMTPSPFGQSCLLPTWL